MASARCYTKSGSIEKYESNLWGIESGGVAVTITGPDSSGNYTVTPQSEYEDSNTPTQFYFTTIYGGVRKTFYFNKKIITIEVHIKVYGYNYNGCVAFDCKVGNYYGTSSNDGIINNILKNNSIYLSSVVITNKGPFCTHTTRLTSVGSLILNTWLSYDNSTQYYIDSSSYCNPSSGTYNGVNWKTMLSIAS